jgi:hypothetical protein
VDAGLPSPLRPNPDIRFRGDTRGRFDGVREELAARVLELSDRRNHVRRIRKYKIVGKAAEYPEQADTYVVVDAPSGEVLSQHESLDAARAAVRKYESADSKRRYLKDLS